MLPININTKTVVDKLDKSNFVNTISILSVKNLQDNSYSNKPDDYRDEFEKSYCRWFLGNNSFQYLYLPIKRYSQLKLRRIIGAVSDSFFIEDTTTVSYFNLIVLLIFSGVCFFFTKKRIMFFVSVLPFLIYGALSKGYLILLSSILSIYTITYWLATVESGLILNSIQLKKRMLNNPVLIIAPVFILILNIILGAKLFALFFLACFSCFSGFGFIHFILKLSAEKNKKHNRIKTYAMNPLSVTMFWNRKKLIIISITAISMMVISFIILNLFYRNDKLNKTANFVSIPAPAVVGEKGFSENDYMNFLSIRKGNSAFYDLISSIHDSWYTNQIQYLSLHKKTNMPIAGDIIKYNEFNVDSNGKVKENENILFEFNSSYIKNTLMRIQAKSIGKMLYSQGRFIQAGQIKYYIKDVNIFFDFALLFFGSMLPLAVILMRILR
ncbi:MAG: hypothetical protein CR988_06865 [Treponema sp.]|nr:MAG: hypothetical protein CR988_06865 [Treponema sp.]